jgi:hypothetical protein
VNGRAVTVMIVRIFIIWLVVADARQVDVARAEHEVAVQLDHLDDADEVVLHVAEVDARRSRG